MKKLFLFFAAMLVAVAVNAAVINITSETPDALRTALNTAETGDEIVMAAGTYVESNSNYIAFTEKNITVRAAEEALVIIQPQVPITLTNGYATFENIKFDASRLNELASWYEHLIYAADASEGNGLSFVNCEFYNFLINKSMIYCSSSNHLSAVNIQNCYFHDIMKSILFVENTSADISVHIANSTIANITTATGYSAGVIDIRNANAEFNVDHCTFYDAMAMNTDYSAVSKISITGSVVSNCIFMLSTAQDGVRAMRGVTANNCLTYNYLKDGGTGIHSSVTPNNCFQADPLFADAANGNFTLAETSPAHEAGVAGTHLGDPRWWPASWQPAAVIPVASVALDANALTLDVNETAYLHATVLPNDATDPSVTWSSSDKAVATVVNGMVKGIAAGTATITAKAGEKIATCEVTVSDVIPSTDFAAPYFLKGTKATLDGNIYLSEVDSLYFQDKSVCGTATWKINATRGCFIGATANFKTGSSSGAKLRIVVLDENEKQVGDSLMQNYYDKDGDKAFTGTIALTEAGVYTIKLVNIQPWSSAKLNGISLNFEGELPTVAAKGAWDEWANELVFTLAKDAKTAAAKKTFNKGDEFEFKMIINGGWRGNGWWYKRDVTGAEGITENGDNMKIIADADGEYTFTWTFATNAIEITFPDLPEPVLPNGFYLVGTFGGEEEWEYANLSATKKFAATEVEGEYTLNYTLAKGDRFKAIYLENDTYKKWYPEGSDNDYLVTEWTAGEKTIYFRPKYHEAWGGHFYIEANKPVVTYNDFEIDLRAGQLGTELQKYLTVGEPYVYANEMPIAYNALLKAASFNGAQHGYVDFVATIPVEAGNYKITVGNCTYNSHNGAVKNADGTETLNLIDKNGQTITAIETPENCYHQNTTENVTSVWFVAEADQTIQIVCPQYAPYIKVEQVAEVPAKVTVYTVTFAHAEGATGVLPATLEDIVPGTMITLPKNTSMYKEGYTFDGWTDGEDLYDPGFEYEVTEDVTLTAVYAENTVSLTSRTDAVMIRWEFSQSKGVAPINVSGKKTFVVAQANVNDKFIDVQLPIDATVGKFVNSANSWTQINPGVIFSIPSAKDAEIRYKKLNEGETTNPIINVAEAGNTYELAPEGTSGKLYIEYIAVLLPKPTATGISNTEAAVKAQKMIENGQIVILKNGVKYNVLGATLK